MKKYFLLLSQCAMRRYLPLMVGVVVSAGWVVGAGAQENAGKIARDEPAALRVQDMTMDELQQRLAEYEAGKRDDRDGYIILNQLWFNYQAQSRTASPDFQAIVSKRDGLLKKRPELGNLQDFRLSDQVRYDKKKGDEQARELTQAKRWAPTDSKLLRIFGAGNRAVAMYQYRLEFYNLPGDVRLARGKNTDRHRLFRGDEELAPSRLQPYKTLTFKASVGVLPVLPDDIATNFLACTNPVARYTPASPEERKTMEMLGHTHGMPWTNKTGQYEQFCGIVSIDGNVIYQFPFTQSLPNKVMSALKMSPDGTWAGVMVGEVVQGEDFPGVGKPREVWIWRQGTGLQKYSAKDNAPVVKKLLQFFPKQ